MLGAISSAKLGVATAALGALLSLSVFLYWHQGKQIKLQKQLIEEIATDRDGYISVLNSLDLQTDKINAAYEDLRAKESNLERRFNHYAKVINKSFEVETWDSEAIPAPLACILNCVQQPSGTCHCESVKNHSELFEAMQNAEIAGE